MLKNHLVIIIASLVLFISGCERHDDHRHTDEHKDEVSESHKHESVETVATKDTDKSSNINLNIDNNQNEEEHDHDSEKDVTDGGNSHNHESDNEHESDNQSIRQTDSHVHGNALLALALDGNTVSIELESPLYNILGFEHAPSTAAENQLVETSDSLLRNPENLFSFNSEASCTLSSNNQDFLLIENNHSEDEHSEHDNQAEHRELLIEYQYQCAAPQKLKTFTTSLFENFPNLSELETVFLGPGTQLQTVLTPSNVEMILSN